ncbi:MAG: peptidoglycan DD-metalloendopeptidase family protein, partial [Acidobacteriota bacterium]|nr:peptidoglycan DD-metalloendopeptidase family protein [Acidobacteriota bacterium]
SATVAALALPATAQTAVLRDVQVTTYGAPDQIQKDAEERGPRFRDVTSDANGTITSGPSTLLVYPVAGRVGQDGSGLSIPYYVDLDPTNVKRDFDCTDLTFNGHTGHDPYLRSFQEQWVGVPVFAVLDGVVADVHDGEADENVNNDPNLRANYVTLRHANEMETLYVHLRRGSITVAKGDVVTAGTQIAQVGSSGASNGPHIHFEVRYRGEAFEPMAGPCRAGRSFFDDPAPAKSSEFTLVGAAFTVTPTPSARRAPFDDTPHTGTFLRGPQTVYFRADLANVGASTQYELKLRSPGSSVTTTAALGTLMQYDASLASVFWTLDVNFAVTGTWEIILDVDHKRTFTRTFRVVNSPVEFGNRAPNPISAEIAQGGSIRSGSVPVCRVVGLAQPDPDFDIVRYHYVWRVNGNLVRSVVSAAQSDALARGLIPPNANISCTVSASDPSSAFTQPVVANTTVLPVRRRSVRSR